VLAVGGEYACGVLGEGHGVYHHDVLPVHLRRIPEEVVDLLEAGLLQREIRPHLVHRSDHVLRVPDDEGVREVGCEPRGNHTLRVVGHVLDEDAPLARREDALQNPLVVVLRPRLHVGVTVAQAILAVVVGGGEGLVQDLEVVPFDENPLERGRYGPWHRPQRDGFVVARDQSQSPSREGFGPPGASTGGPAISAVRFLRYGPSSTTCPAPRGGGPDTPPACRRSRGTRGCSRRALRPRR
jgi:hypothetical protein